MTCKNALSYYEVLYFSLLGILTIIQAQFASLLSHYISRGCPQLHVDTLRDFRPKRLIEEPNPWLDVIKASLEEEHESHVIKTVRSLYKAEQEFGPHKDNLYLRAAQLTVEGYEKYNWSQNGIGWDEDWSEEEIEKTKEKLQSFVEPK